MSGRMSDRKGLTECASTAVAATMPHSRVLLVGPAPELGDSACRDALQHGYALTPIYTFGESETYATFPYLLKPRLWRRASSSPLPPARPVRGLRPPSLLS